MKKTILSKCFLHSVLLTLAFCLFPVLPACAQEDIVDRLDKALGVTLPSEYRSKVKEFVANDTIMRTRSATQYTEEFIKDEMKKDWGISKQNQLLFMWSKIYGGISQAKLYNLLDDENTARRNEYKKALRPIADFYMEYETGFKAYMEEKSAEADRRSAEAKQRSAEADRRSAEAERRSAEAVKVIVKQDSIWVKERMVEFYDIYTQNPNIIKQDDLSFMKKSTIGFIADCKKFNIDYRAILLKELGDKKKVEELLKFYGVE